MDDLMRQYLARIYQQAPEQQTTNYGQQPYERRVRPQSPTPYGSQQSQGNDYKQQIAKSLLKNMGSGSAANEAGYAATAGASAPAGMSVGTGTAAGSAAAGGEMGLMDILAMLFGA
jgi:hypothetical protein